jgi:thiamine biosynthesis lipoprotein
MTAVGIVARHHTQVMGTHVSFSIFAPADLTRREIGEALGAAVAELRAVDTAFSPFRPRSLVSAVRRGELEPGGYPPPLVDILTRCAAMRAATDGWFDAWAPQGGFDPSGLVKGWAVDRAGTLLRLAGIAEFTIWAGTDRLSYRGRAAEAFALSGTAYPRHGVPRVVDPHTGGPAHSRGPAGVAGSELALANAYAVALNAIGEPGLSWFPTVDGYHAVLVNGLPCWRSPRPRGLSHLSATL